MRPIPISKVCPHCGAEEYRKVRAKRWLAFTDDRVCLSCDTRYAPPTPRWAGVVFASGGAVLFAVGALLMGVQVLALLGGRADAISAAIAGGLMALGIAAGIHGLRALVSPGSV